MQSTRHGGHFTLKRLMISILVLSLLIGGGIAWFWQYAHAPQGRARTIIAQVKGDKASLRGWMLDHQLIRPEFVPPTDSQYVERLRPAQDAMVRLGRQALPVVVEALADENRDVRLMAVLVCSEMPDPSEIAPLSACITKAIGDDGDHPASIATPIDSSMKYRGVGALYSNGKPAIPALLAVMKEPRIESYVRSFAARCLAELGREEGPQYLLNAIRDGGYEECTSAVLEAQSAGVEVPLDLLLKILEADPEEDLQLVVLGAIEAKHDPRVIPLLKKLLKGGKSRVIEFIKEEIRDLENPPDSRPAQVD